MFTNGLETWAGISKGLEFPKAIALWAAVSLAKSLTGGPLTFGWIPGLTVSKPFCEKAREGPFQGFDHQGEFSPTGVGIKNA